MKQKGIKHWKIKNAKPTVWQKLNRKHEFTVFNRIEKISIICLLISVSFLSFTGIYYTVNVTPYQPSGSANLDPFTPIWNGSIYAPPPGGTPTILFSTVHAHCDIAACTMSVTLTSKGTVAVSSWNADATCTGASDTLGNSYSLVISASTGHVFGAITVIGGSTTITVSGCDGSFTSIMAVEYSGGNFGNNNKASGNVATPFTSTVALTTSAGSATFEYFGFQNNGGLGCDTPLAQNGQSKTLDDCTNSGSGFGIYVSNWNTVPVAGSNNYGILVGGLGGASILYSHILVEITGLSLCPPGYVCVNSYQANNDIVLAANSTISAIALNKNPIDFSILSSKEMLIYETKSNSSNVVSSKPFGWYLTLNQTLPTQVNYSPLNDTSVVLAFVAYGGHTYVYIARSVGNQLLPDSGLGKDPYPNCPQSSTLFLCASGGGSNGAAFTAMSLVLNFTGPGNQNSWGGFLCAQSVLTASFFTFGGASCAGAQTITIPWFNIQNSYSLGFFSAANQTTTITFGSSGTSATFSERANAIYYWVPNPTTNTPSTTDTGGFIGWLGRSLGGTWNTITGVLAPLGQPLVGFGNTLLGTFVGALSQFVGISIQGLKTALNAVGNFFGMGNIGDSLIAVFSSLGTILVNIVGVVIGFFTLVAQVVSSAFTTLVVNAATIFNGMVTLIIIFYNLIFSNLWAIQVIIFLDYCYGILQLYFKGMRGLWAWIQLNLFIFLLLPNIAWEIFDDVTRGYERIKIMVTGYV